MKIIDKRVDYYDGLARAYRDEEPVYIRTPGETSIKTNRKSEFSVLGFCGKAYPFYHAVLPVRGPVINYDRNSAVSMIVAGLSARQRGSGKWHDWWLKGRIQFFSDSWDSLSSTRWEVLFSQAPIWLMREVTYSASRVELNPLLKPLGFFKIEPPAQAFQRLSMWLNNQARPLKPMPTIPDELKAQSKGFDKNSFRGFDRRK